MLLRTQVYLTAQEKTALTHLAAQTGKTQSEIIREAIDAFCETHLEENRHGHMTRARGLWKNRKDLPDFSKLRKEWNRN